MTGRASIPVTAVVTHALAHRFVSIAMYDPKLDRYVVAVAHGGELRVGDLLTESEIGRRTDRRVH